MEFELQQKKKINKPHFSHIVKRIKWRKIAKYKHLKHQKEEAAGGDKIIHTTHVLNKYSGIDVLSTFKLGLCFWISSISVINNFRQWLVWAIISVSLKSILWSGLSAKCLDTSVSCLFGEVGWWFFNRVIKILEVWPIYPQSVFLPTKSAK